MGLSAQSNVGIGNTNPAYSLDVNGILRLRFKNGTEIAPAILFNNSSGTGTALLGYWNDSTLRLAHEQNAVSGTVRTGIYFNYEDARIGIQREAGTFFGNIAIPPDALDPLYPLHVRTTSDTIGLFIDRPLPGLSPSNLGRGAGILFRTGSVYTGAIRPYGTGGNANELRFYGGGSSNTIDNMPLRMVIANNGNIGINTPTPTARLDVDGTLRLREGAGSGRVLISDANGQALWQEPIAFYARVSSNKVITNTESKINFGTELYDYQNTFNGTEFTAPENGVYHFDVMIENVYASGVTASPSNSIELVLYPTLPGGLIRRAYTNLPNATNISSPTIAISTDFLMVAGQKMDVRIVTNYSTGTTTLFSFGGFFSGHKVR